MNKLSHVILGIAFGIATTGAFAASSDVKAVARDVGAATRGSVEAHSGGHQPVRAGGISLKAGRGASPAINEGHTVRSHHMDRFGRA